MSAALGETHEWLNAAEIPDLPAALAYVKLGGARLGAAAGWEHAWHAVRRRFAPHLNPATGWIAVAYVDWQEADSPPPAAVIEAALAADCRGVLFDTYTKSGQSLLDAISADELQSLVGIIQDAGLLAALAGSLRITDLAALHPIPADIVAIRTAACPEGLRAGEVDEQLVRRFKQALSGQKQA